MRKVVGTLVLLLGLVSGNGHTGHERGQGQWDRGQGQGQWDRGQGQGQWDRGHGQWNRGHGHRGGGQQQQLSLFQQNQPFPVFGNFLNGFGAGIPFDNPQNPGGSNIGEWPKGQSSLIGQEFPGLQTGLGGGQLGMLPWTNGQGQVKGQGTQFGNNNFQWPIGSALSSGLMGNGQNLQPFRPFLQGQGQGPLWGGVKGREPFGNIGGSSMQVPSKCTDHPQESLEGTHPGEASYDPDGSALDTGKDASVNPPIENNSEGSRAPPPPDPTPQVPQPVTTNDPEVPPSIEPPEPNAPPISDPAPVPANLPEEPQPSSVVTPEDTPHLSGEPSKGPDVDPNAENAATRHDEFDSGDFDESDYDDLLASLTQGSAGDVNRNHQVAPKHVNEPLAIDARVNLGH